MIWGLLARLLAKPAVTDWLIRRAMRTPYTHIHNNGDLYMERYWLFNPYEPDSPKKKRFPISIRLHKIVRPDDARHHHDHPWNARTIILRDWYEEVRLESNGVDDFDVPYLRQAGDTATINFGEYHTITRVPPDGVWTMFITGPYRGTWGFLVDGVKVHWKKYLGE